MSLLDEVPKGKKPQNTWYFKIEFFCINKLNLQTNAFKNHEDRYFRMKLNKKLIVSDRLHVVILPFPFGNQWLLKVLNLEQYLTLLLQQQKNKQAKKGILFKYMTRILKWLKYINSRNMIFNRSFLKFP